MTLRDIQLPGDLNPLAEMVVKTFQYPENPNWSVQTDEKEALVDAIKNFSRIWLLIRLAGFFSKPVQDLLRGCVWEEDGVPVGTTIVQRRSSTTGWVVGTVGVLPGFRRRGIARKCVVRALDIIREHGGEKATLGVIDGNLPAHALYESLGFEVFQGPLNSRHSPKRLLSSQIFQMTIISHPPHFSIGNRATNWSSEPPREPISVTNPSKLAGSGSLVLCAWYCRSSFAPRDQ
jgi:GNAT superfamily N-acetyltransferase